MARNVLNYIFHNNSLTIPHSLSLLKKSIPFRFTSYDVKHDPEDRIIYVEVGNQRAYVRYRERGHVLRLTATVVPEELAGKGIGKMLAHATFKYIQDNDLKMEINCDFLQHYLDKYGEEFQKYVN